MDKPAKPPYEEWQLTLPPISPPSTLYALVPIGIGTPLVESMTSSIARVALPHCVFPGVLMRKIMAPFAQSHLMGTRGSTAMDIGDGKATGAFHWAHHRARNVVNAWENVTRHQRLHALTMLPWTEVCPLVGWIRTDRPWCPCCLEEWRTSGHSIYEPLLWAVPAGKICPQHGCRLEIPCPTCSRTSRWLAGRSRPGYCAHCHQWLGMGLMRPEEHEQEMIWFKWCAQQVGTLLALVPPLTRIPSRARIDEGLPALLEQVSQGREMTFARLVGLSEKMGGSWFYLRQLPSVANLLRICFAVNLSLQDFLLGKQQITCTLRSEGTPYLWDRSSRRSARGFWKTAQVREKLEAIALSEQVPPPSLQAVARQLGGEPHYWKISHPMPCQAISDRYAAYMNTQK